MRFKGQPVVICIAALLCVGALGACSKAPERRVLRDLPNYYDAAVTIVCEDFSATATLRRETPASCAVSFTSPETIEDLSCTFAQEGVKVSYAGLDFSFGTALPPNAVAGLIVSALDEVLGAQELVAQSPDGPFTVEAGADSAAYTLTLDKETGAPQKLVFSEQGIEIAFDLFTFL